jgi:hypothetical protein
MKKILLSAALCVALACSSTVNAQENAKPIISNQPLWGPTGYNLAAYYFLPDIEAYYDIPEKKFIYLDNGKWTFSTTLPEKFKDYDLYSGYKVVLNRPHPYFNLNAHKARYGRFKGQIKKQETILESTNPKYFVVDGHPKGAGVTNVQNTKPSANSLAGN